MLNGSSHPARTVARDELVWPERQVDYAVGPQRVAGSVVDVGVVQSSIRGIGESCRKTQVLAPGIGRLATETMDRTNRCLNFQRVIVVCLLYTSDAADERSSVDLGG